MEMMLKEQLIRSMFRFRKVVGVAFRPREDISMCEIALMKGIEDKSLHSGNQDISLNFQNSLHITKPAISQMYNTLEKKGYITREIDTSDRRKIIASLTPEGREILKGMTKSANSMLDEVITRLGEEDTKQLIELFNRLADISEDIRKTANKNEDKGETSL
jgi:DNA-binding MarR family transcriptional regulator